MASASEVRDILNLPQQNTAPKPAVAPKKNLRRESGITRELYSLIGDNAPTLVAQYARPKFKQKPDLGRGKVKWEWKEFNNPARTDGLQLAHWVKTSPADPQEEYPFAKYSKNAPVAYDYSMDEYNRMLEDADWTREETDYLFNLVKEYDVRFFVIADRYDFPGGKPRSLQDLKARYFGVCRKLIKARPFAGDDASKNAAISSYTYDKAREEQRKLYLNNLFGRTPAQIAEEEALYIEAKRIEQNERRFQRERDDLLRTLGGIESGLASLALRLDDPTQAFPPPGVGARRPRRSDGMDVDPPSAGGSNNMIALPSPYSGPSSLPGSSARKTSLSGSVTPKAPPAISISGIPAYSQPETEFDPVNCLTRPAPGSYQPPLSSVTKSAHKPVHLRSTLIPIPKTNIHARLTALLNEMGVNPSRLVMPTTGNIQKMEELHQAAVGLLDMKKTVDKVDQEIRVLKARLRGGSEAADTDADGTGEADRGGDREMSVASTGGDKNKRSASITSSSTSMIPDARPGKRQRRL